MSDEVASTPVVVADPEAVAQTAAERVAQLIAAAVDARGSCSWALAGGTTPQRMYELMREAKLPWGSIDVYFGDERCVPPDHADSNYRMAHTALLAHVPIAPGRVHRMEGEAADRDAAAARYAAILPDALDVLLLGMGPDGHTASLFPGAPTLDETSPVAVVRDSPKPPPFRFTITPPVIGAARHVVMVATGATKAERVAAILSGRAAPHEAPAALARSGLWILDTAAASRLPPSI